MTDVESTPTTAIEKETEAVSADVPEPTVETSESAAATTEEVVTEATETVAVETEAEAETTNDVVEQKVEEEEIEEITEGILHKKGPLPFFNWAPRHFYFHDEPYELSKLKNVFKKHGKGDEIFQAIAHATFTGKGLLFYTTTPDHTAEPYGIIILNQVNTVATTNAKAHQFKIVTKHHTWEVSASEHKEFKRWRHTILKKKEETKDITAQVEESEVYKATLEKLQKRIAFASEKTAEGSSVTATAITNEPESEAVTETVVKSEETTKVVKTEEATKTKRRSIFPGNLPSFFSKKESEPQVPSTEAPATEASATEATTEATTDAPTTEAPPAEAVVDASIQVAVAETIADSFPSEIEEELKLKETTSETVPEAKIEETEVKVTEVEKVEKVEVKVESPTTERRWFSSFGKSKKVPASSAPAAEPKPEEPKVATDVQITEESTAVVTEVEVKETTTEVAAEVEPKSTEEVLEAKVTEAVTTGESSAPKRKFTSFFVGKKADEKKPDEPKVDETEATPANSPVDVVATNDEESGNKKKEEKEEKKEKKDGLMRRITSTFGKKPKPTATTSSEVIAESSSAEKVEEVKVEKEIKEVEATAEAVAGSEVEVETKTTEVTVIDEGKGEVTEVTTTTTTTVTKEVTTDVEEAVTATEQVA